MPVTPTRPVTLSTAVAALVALILALTSLDPGPDVTAALITLATAVAALATRSAKVVAGTLAGAVATVAVWTAAQAGVDLPPDSVSWLTVLVAFAVQWSTSEA